MTRYTLDTSDTHKYGEILVVGEGREDYITVGPKDGDEDKPNYEMAHLIAAAPDLYEALDRLVGEIKDYHVSSSVLDAIEASIYAIAKALGEA